MKAMQNRERGSAGQHQGAAMKKGWQTKTLGDICEMYQPKTISGKDMIEDGKYLVYGANGVIGRYNEFNHEDPQLLITCRGATCGSVNVSAPRSWVTGNAMVVRPKYESLEMRYLEYLFRGGIDISKAITGAAQPQITRTNLEPLEISFPESLVEQQRIVGLLDEAFEGLATAKANAEKNLQNARALFESHLQSVFTQRGPGWVEKSLGEVCVVKDGTHDSPKYVTDGIPFVTQKNIREDGLSFERIKLISQEDHDDFYRRSNAAHGDILISMIGANRGMACIVDDERTFSIKNVGLVKQNPSINQEFLLYFLKSPQAAGFVKGVSKGGAQEFVGLTELRRFPVPLPPLERQNAFAEIFQSLREETQRLFRLYERKIVALEALKKSLLHQAFSGEL